MTYQQREHEPLSQYQSRTAMEFRALRHRFIEWLEQAGVLVQEPTSMWELLRYRACLHELRPVSPDKAIGNQPVEETKVYQWSKPRSSVVYRNRDGAVNMTGDSMVHWQMFRAGQSMPAQPDNLAPGKKGRSWTERTREKLLSRDGMNCWFCGKTMELDHEGRPTEGGKPDITIEHILSRHNMDAHAAEGTDINHIDYLVLAHAKCNRDIGHRPVTEKMVYRELLHDRHTRVDHWASPKDTSDEHS